MIFRLLCGWRVEGGGSRVRNYSTCKDKGFLKNWKDIFVLILLSKYNSYIRLKATTQMMTFCRHLSYPQTYVTPCINSKSEKVDLYKNDLYYVLVILEF